jgi:hypothetical protein
VQQELSILERLALLAPEVVEWVLQDVPLEQLEQLGESWHCVARPSQLPPEGNWSQWLILAGRGFGKTRAGAEWVTELAQAEPGARFALVGATAHDVASVMVEGQSGLLAVSDPDFQLEWLSSRRMLVWPNGAQAFALSAAEPNQLRGPQFHFAWCDELAAWPRPQEAWDNLRMGLRLPVGAPAGTLVMMLPRGGGAQAQAGRDSVGRDMAFLVDGYGDPIGGSLLTYRVRGSGWTPLSPVHLRSERRYDGTLMCGWAERDRNAWRWDAPEIISGQRYLCHFRVGAGATYTMAAVGSDVRLDPADQIAAFGALVAEGQFRVEAMGDGPAELRITPWVAI